MRRLRSLVRDRLGRVMTRLRNAARWIFAKRRGCLYEVQSGDHRIRIEAPTSRELYALFHLFGDEDGDPRLLEDLR